MALLGTLSAGAPAAGDGGAPPRSPLALSPLPCRLSPCGGAAGSSLVGAPRCTTSPLPGSPRQPRSATSPRLVATAVPAPCSSPPAGGAGVLGAGPASPGGGRTGCIRDLGRRSVGSAASGDSDGSASGDDGDGSASEGGASDHEAPVAAGETGGEAAGEAAGGSAVAEEEEVVAESAVVACVPRSEGSRHRRSSGSERQQRRLSSSYASAAQTLQHHLLMCLKLLGVMVEGYRARCLQRPAEVEDQGAAKTAATSERTGPVTYDRLSPRLAKVVGAEMDPMVPPGLPWRPPAEHGAGAKNASLKSGDRFVLTTVMLDSSLRGALESAEAAQERCFAEFPETINCRQDEFVSFDGTLTTVYEDEDAETKVQRAELPQERPIEPEEHELLRAEYRRILGSVARLERESTSRTAQVSSLEEARRELRVEKEDLSPSRAIVSGNKAEIQALQVPHVLSALGIRAEGKDASSALVAPAELGKLAESMRKISREADEATNRATIAMTRATGAASEALAWDKERVQLLELLDEGALDDNVDVGTAVTLAVRALVKRRADAINLIKEREQQSNARRTPPSASATDSGSTQSKLKELTKSFAEVQEHYHELVSVNCQLRKKLAGGQADASAQQTGSSCVRSASACSSASIRSGSPSEREAATASLAGVLQGPPQGDGRPGTPTWPARLGPPQRPGMSSPTRVGRAPVASHAGRETTLRPLPPREAPPRELTSFLGNGAPLSKTPSATSLRRRAGLLGPSPPHVAAPSAAPATATGSPVWADNRQLSRAALRYAKNPGDGHAISELVTLLRNGANGGASAGAWQEADNQPAPEPKPEAGVPSPPLPAPVAAASRQEDFEKALAAQRAPSLAPFALPLNVACSACAPQGAHAAQEATAQAHGAAVGAAIHAAVGPLPSKVVAVPASWDGQRRAAGAVQPRPVRVQLLAAPPFPPPAGPPPEFPRPPLPPGQGCVQAQPPQVARLTSASLLGSAAAIGLSRGQPHSASAHSLGAPPARSLSPADMGPRMVRSASASLSPERAAHAYAGSQVRQVVHHSHSPGAAVRLAHSPVGASRHHSPSLGQTSRSPSPLAAHAPVVLAGAAHAGCRGMRATWPIPAAHAAYARLGQSAGAAQAFGIGSGGSSSTRTLSPQTMPTANAAGHVTIAGRY